MSAEQQSKLFEELSSAYGDNWWDSTDQNERA